MLRYRLDYILYLEHMYVYLVGLYSKSSPCAIDLFVRCSLFRIIGIRINMKSIPFLFHALIETFRVEHYEFRLRFPILKTMDYAWLWVPGSLEGTISALIALNSDKKIHVLLRLFSHLFPMRRVWCIRSKNKNKKDTYSVFPVCVLRSCECFWFLSQSWTNNRSRT